MSAPRIFTPQPLAEDASLLLEQPASRHLSRVLRLGPGESVRLFDGAGREARARIQSVSAGRVEVRISSVSDPEPEPALRITLAQGLARGERMDYAIQKAVELGVHEIVPLLTERCVVRLQGERLQRRLAHWHGIAVAACEQSHRRRLPRVAEAQPLEDWLRGLEIPGILLQPAAGTRLPDLPPPGGALALLIGPEGGLSDRELRLAMDRGLRDVRLGPRVLRTETAPVAALAAIQTLWGDFR